MTVNIQKGMAPNNESYLAGRKRRHEGSKEYPEDKRLKMDDGALTSCGIVLKYLMQHAYGKVFNEPIDPVKLGFPDYFEIIANPMDLGTIRRKLYLNTYEHVESFEADVMLTFSNAMLQHKPSSEVYQYAKELITMFEFHWKPVIEKIMREQGNMKQFCRLNTCKTLDGVDNNCQERCSSRMDNLPGRSPFRKFVDHNHRKVMPPRISPAQSGRKLRSEKPRTAALHISDYWGDEVVLDNATAATSTLDVQHSPSEAMRMLKSRRGKFVLGVGSNLTSRKLEEEMFDSKQHEEKDKIKAQVRASDYAECSRAGFECQRQRENDRQAARAALDNMKRTVDLDDNIDALNDLNLRRPLLFRREFRNGKSLVSWFQSESCYSVNPLKDLGLFLKS